MRMRLEAIGPASGRTMSEAYADPSRWTWRVRLGPAALTIDHEVADGRTAAVLDGLGAGRRRVRSGGPARALSARAPVRSTALVVAPVRPLELGEPHHAEPEHGGGRRGTR